MSRDELLGQALLGLARDAIDAAVGLSGARRPLGAHPALAAPGASFVTLTRDGSLRGCIGSLEAHRPLAEDVAANAVAAALRDPRFEPLGRNEAACVRVEVSLLGRTEAIAAASEREAIDALVPHLDGVVLAWAGRRATFLPQVWQSLPDAREFLAMLRRKAGLPADFWAPGIELARYRVSKWTEPAQTGMPT